MLSLELSADYPDEKTARAIMEALQPDNVGYVESEVKDNVLFFRMSADNAGTLRNTADDLIACLKIAEDAVGMTPRD